MVVTELDQLGLVAKAAIFFDAAFNANDPRGIFTHELGHLLSLPEAYDEDLNPSQCTSGQSSVMDRTQSLINFVYGPPCDSSVPTSFDESRVASVYSASFGATPKPQPIRASPLGDTQAFAVLKVPNAGGFTVQRGDCASTEVAQPFTFVYPDNPHLIKVDFPYGSDGRDTCTQFRSRNGSGTFSSWSDDFHHVHHVAPFVDGIVRDYTPEYQTYRLVSGGSFADSDGDGCSDAEELGSNIDLGGQRNLSYWWDFFDVPVPALESTRTYGYLNQVIDLPSKDSLAVNYYSGTSTSAAFTPNNNGVYYASDWDGNGILDGEEYDRVANGAVTARPNGVVTGADALMAFSQRGDRCDLPPP